MSQQYKSGPIIFVFKIPHLPHHTSGTCTVVRKHQTSVLEKTIFQSHPLGLNLCPGAGLG